MLQTPEMVQLSLPNFLTANKVKSWPLRGNIQNLIILPKSQVSIFLVNLRVLGLGNELSTWKDKTLKQKVKVLFYPILGDFASIPLGRDLCTNG